MAAPQNQSLKDTYVTVPDNYGRDAGKVFHIHEMPAMRVETWAGAAVVALARGGITVPAGLEHTGLLGLAILGFKALEGCNFMEIKPLLDEMMECVKFCHEPSNRLLEIDLHESHIMEVKTLWFLREEVFKLHTGFSFADAMFLLISASARIQSPGSSPTTPMSPAPSAQLSPQA